MELVEKNLSHVIYAKISCFHHPAWKSSIFAHIISHFLSADILLIYLHFLIYLNICVCVNYSIILTFYLI